MTIETARRASLEFVCVFGQDGLKLSGILATLPERIAYAQKAKLPSEDLLELILQDEVDTQLVL